MKKIIWIKYVIYSAVLFGLVVLKGYVEQSFIDAYYRFEDTINIYMAVSLLIGVAIGSILGMEYFLCEWKKAGKWKVNVPKLVLLGLPSLYVSLYFFWLMSGSRIIREIIAYPLAFIFRYGSSYISLFQLILGYAIITAFHKAGE